MAWGLSGGTTRAAVGRREVRVHGAEPGGRREKGLGGKGGPHGWARPRGRKDRMVEKKRRRRAGPGGFWFRSEFGAFIVLSLV